MIRVPGFEGRRVAVFGLGRSGLTAARALKAGGAEPVLWDDGISSRMQAEAEGFAVEDLTTSDWSGFAALVLAPGVPLTHPVPHWTVEKAQEAGVEIVGDLELFARALAALPAGKRPRVVAITGTNGKSTTTALIAWVLKQAGLTVHMGGNIGIGVLALPEPVPGAVYVIECSSYQLDLTTRFAPDVAILTNISPDHLDRHGGMDGYVAAKARIFEHAGLSLVGVDEQEGQRIETQLALAGRRTQQISSKAFSTPLDHILYDNGWIRLPGQSIDLTAARSLAGRHNAQNAAFAYGAARELGVDHETAVEGLLSFPGLAHRMEPVGRVGRVRFINDSKATNADAARQALGAIERVFWIAGGRAKAGGIDDLTELFPRVVEAFLIGEAAGPFAAALGEVPHRISGDMASAVQQAFEAASATGREEVVLLSPAAASFDQFPDFEVRGEAFRAAALALGAQPEGAA
jgi:UDP-N-acetylmuramoylalanine--D-glutamate ligase